MNAMLAIAVAGVALAVAPTGVAPTGTVALAFAPGEAGVGPP
jgi:hypothetical protein